MHGARTTEPFLTDEVWAELNPHAGRLTRRQSILVCLMIAVALLLVAISGGIVRSGFITPRLRGDGSRFAMVMPVEVSAATPATLSLTFILYNDGGMTVSLRSVGASTGALRLIDRRNVPAALQPSTGQEVTLVYQFSSCDDFFHTLGLSQASSRKYGVPVPIEVNRWWGVQHLELYVDQSEWSCNGQ